MVGRLFGKRKRRPSGASSESLGDSVRDARVGDVFTYPGPSLEYEDSYFIVEKMNRYEGYAGKSYELLGVDGDKRLWVQWSDEGGLFASVMPDEEPMGLAQLGIGDDQLVRMDEEHSIDNSVTYEGSQCYYKNSGETYYFQDNAGDGEGFYLWEFTADGRVVSVVKWEGLPFQVYVSDVVSPDSISVYKR